MTAQISAVLLIVAFVVLAASAVIGVPGLYAAENIDAQVELIGAHRRRWLGTQALVSLYVLVATAGFVALAVDLASSVSVLLPAVAAVAIGVGSASGLYFVYLQTADPRGGYSGKYPLPEVAAYWLWLAGVLVLGVALLAAGPLWLGLLAVGGAVVFLAFYLITGMGFVTPAFTAVVGLVIGVEMLLR